jgi:hypothetical protein
MGGVWWPWFRAFGVNLSIAFHLRSITGISFLRDAMSKALCLPPEAQ